MFRARMHLFRLFGIPVNVDASWLVILVLLTWTLADLFHKQVQDLAAGTYWIMGLITALAFFACIVLHELGHAVVARAIGIPIRGITLFLFGGVAELESEPAAPGSEFLMAVAGPIVTAVLAIAFWILSWMGPAWDWNIAAVAIFHYLAWVNTIVLVFNLIPAFPLDGGRVLRSALWGSMGSLRRATYWASLSGQAFAWLLIGLGVFSFLALGAEGIFSGIWLCLIGLFLNNAAQGGYQQVLVRQVLQGEPVARFMNTHPIVVPPKLDLRHWVDDFVYRYHRKMFPVASNGHLEGVIGTQALGQFPREEWDRHAVAEVMKSDLGLISISPRADALQALGKMRATGSSRLVVTDGDRLVGIVSLKDLLGFLHLKLELEDEEVAPGA